MSTRFLVIGFDGFEPTLARALGRERLPNLFRLAERGVLDEVRSVPPASTLPNWSTFLTTADPGHHGVFDFTMREGYGVRFTAGTVRAVKTWVEHLDERGMTTACLAFPATWPPPRLEHGVFLSGWDSPVDFEADESFAWPPSFGRELREKFGPWRFDDADEFHADEPGWHGKLSGTLTARIERKTQIASWLLDSKEWDVFALYFGESDTAAHHLWAHHDETSPRHPKGLSAHDRGGLVRVYEALDAALGELALRAGGDDVEVTVISDHGAGGSGDKVLFLNEALAEMGFLSKKPRHMSSSWTGPMKDAALRLLSPRMRQRAFRVASRALPGWLESRHRFADIDFSKTRAFSDELNYFPSIHLNERGREPLGTVAPQDRGRVLEDLRSSLLSLKDPWDGAPVLSRVHLREEIYEGPLVSRAPDLVLEPNLDGGHSYNLLPSRLGDGKPWQKLDPRDHLGRKGRSLPGSHRPLGTYLVSGPNARRDARTPTMAEAALEQLARIGVEPPAHAARPRTTRLSDEAIVEERLRALGYVE
jgi:predicted AlkP superfamily phosphohydrolase/phosphomutase